MQVWNVLHAARWNCRTSKLAQKSPSRHHRTTLSGYIFTTKACIDNRTKNLLNSNTSSTCPRNMVNFGPLAAEIGSGVWGTPANFNGFRVLASLLHGTLVMGVSQTLRRWTEGATYILQGGHILVSYILMCISIKVYLLTYLISKWEQKPLVLRAALMYIQSETSDWFLPVWKTAVSKIKSSWATVSGHYRSVARCQYFRLLSNWPSSPQLLHAGPDPHRAFGDNKDRFLQARRAFCRLSNSIKALDWKPDNGWMVTYHTGLMMCQSPV